MLSIHFPTFEDLIFYRPIESTIKKLPNNKKLNDLIMDMQILIELKKGKKHKDKL